MDNVNVNTNAKKWRGKETKMKSNRLMDILPSIVLLEPR